MNISVSSGVSQRTLAWWLIAIVAVVAGRLVIAGIETHNWAGVIISLSHVLVVAIGCWYALRPSFDLAADEE